MSLSQFLRVCVFGGVLLGLTPLAQAGAVEDLIAQAQAALQAGDAAKAYDTLAAAEPDYAGNVEFDYWFGLSAVRAGEAGRASFALERVVLEKPNHAGARLELATAYMQLGQRDAAADELEKLETMNPPPQAQQRIDAMNKELNRQATNERKRRNGGYVGVEYGDDDNVGTWPQGLEFFPGASLDAIESTYAAIKAGYWHRFNVAADQKLTVSANGQFRRNSEDDAEQFDQDYLSARAEWVKDLDGRKELALTADLGTLKLDGEDYYLMYGAVGEYRMKVSDTSRFTTGVQLRQFDFDLDQYDYLQTRILGRLNHRPSNKLEATFDFTADYETADNARAGGDAVVFGINGLVWYNVAVKQRLGASLGYSRAAYRRDYALGQAITTETGPRDDDRLSSSLMYDWFPGQSWQVRGQAMYRDQDSTLEAFTYDQTVLSLGLNYYF